MAALNSKSQSRYPGRDWGNLWMLRQRLQKLSLKEDAAAAG